MLGFGQQTTTGIEKKFQDDDLANRRKPRMYTTLSGKQIFIPEYPLDFCIWLDRNFDMLVAEMREAERKKNSLLAKIL